MTQTPPSSQRRRRTLLVCLCIIGALFLALLSAPWWGRLPLAYFVRGQLLEMGLQDVRLDIAHLGITSLRVENLHAQWQGSTLDTAHLEISYDPFDLISGRIESIIITGLHADVLIDPFLAQTVTPEDKPDEPAKPLRESIPPALPFERILLADSRLTLRLGQQAISWHLQGNLEGRSDCKLALMGDGPDAEFTFTAELDLPSASGETTLNLAVQSLKPALEPFADRLPESLSGLEIVSGPVQFDAALAIEDARPAHWALILTNLEGAANMPPYEISYLNLALGASGQGTVPDHLWLTLDHAHAGNGDSGLSWSKLTTELRGGQRLDITLQKPAAYHGDMRAALPEGTLGLAALGSFDPTNFRPDHRIKLAVPVQPFTASQGDITMGGKLSAKSSLRWQGGEPDGTVNFNLLDVNVQAPAYSADLNDLSGNIALSQLLPPTTDIAQQLNFKSLTVGEYTFSDGELQLQLSPSPKASSEADLRFETDWLDGGIKARAIAPIDKPEDAKAVLILEHVDANKLSALVPDFQGVISGKISGKLNAALRDNQIIIQQGWLEMDGDNAGELSIPRGSWQLSGMSSEQIDELVVGKRIDEIFQIPGGETIVTELALRDLQLDAFNLTIHPRSQEGPRVVIHVEGSSQVAGATVPIVLDIPIRIDLEAAIQDWLKYNEMTAK